MRLQLTLLMCAVAIVDGLGESEAAADDDRDWSLNTDTLYYTDSDNVVVVSPQVSAKRRLDDEGGAASARVIVDVVSAASVDVVSQATTRFSETRTEVDLAASKTVGAFLPGIRYSYSQEPDYVSHGLGGSIQREIRSPDTTLSLAYDVALDTVGHVDTAPEVFSEGLTSQIGTLSLTQVLGPKTLARGIYSLSRQSGYLEKPYRYVPLFDEAGIAAAEADGVTLDLSNFDRYRLSARPPEEVPDRRWGHALGIRGLRYLDALPGSVKLDYQFFSDTWGIRAHTIEPQLAWKVAESHTVSGYGRLYLQSAVSFWRRTYVVEPGEVPTYRTLDRDLSSYQMAVGGARYQWNGSWISAYLDLSAMYTRYDNYLFLDSRTALIAQGGARFRL